MNDLVFCELQCLGFRVDREQWIDCVDCRSLIELSLQTGVDFILL